MNGLEARLNKAAPKDHITFKTELEDRIKLAGVGPNHYT
jgi:hypothetical protein